MNSKTNLKVFNISFSSIENPPSGPINKDDLTKALNKGELVLPEYDILNMYMPIYVADGNSSICGSDEVYYKGECYIDVNKNGKFDTDDVYYTPDYWKFSISPSGGDWKTPNGITEKEITG
jgi:hypothetical protein